MSETSRPNLILIPVELRKDLRVHLEVPADLTAQEAERIARIVKAYAAQEPTDD